jgi:trimethylamine:corrinoid methyltransferase-like protein
MDSAVWKPQLTLLDGAKIETLHQAATTILARTGLNVHHPELRRRLTGAGAGLGVGERVTIPAGMVSQALSRIKREVVIYNRLGEPVMPLGPHQIYFGTGVGSGANPRPRERGLAVVGVGGCGPGGPAV